MNVTVFLNMMHFRLTDILISIRIFISHDLDAIFNKLRSNKNIYCCQGGAIFVLFVAIASMSNTHEKATCHTFLNLRGFI
jgi:hypothetical protein